VTATVPHQAIYRRWRAQTFSQIVGQAAVVETLRNAVRTGRVAHAILFVGPRGTGKTSLARILAKAVNCTNLQDGDPCDACASCVAIREGRALDLIEIDAASNRGIDAVRELRERIHYAPTDLRRKVYILDEAHQITKDAWNALLKSLEEPPEFVTFMFASTHPQEFPPAILSRLQRYDIRRLTPAEIEGKLARILEADGRQAEPEAVSLIARLAAGGMRDAESMLDQLLASSTGRLDADRVRDLLGLADAETLESFVGALVDGDAVRGITILDALEERGRDLRVFLDQLLGAIREALMASLSPGATGVRSTAALTDAARRLASIDPNRAGVGGLRLQLELTLFAAGDRAPAAQPVRAGTSRTPIPRSPAAATETPPAERAPDPAKRTPGPTRAPVAPQPAAEPAPASDARPGPAPAPLPAAPSAEFAPGPTASAQASAEREPGMAAPEPTPTPPAPIPPAAVDRAQSPPDAGAPGGGDDLDLLRDRWTEIVAAISQNPAVKPLVTVCRPISVDGNVVTLGFPEGQAFLRDVAERRRPALEDGIGRFLGRAVTVRCVATNLEVGPPAAEDPDSAYVLAEARRIFADDLADVGEVG